MPKVRKETYPEIEEIKEDLDSLKDNVVQLTKHIQKDGAEHASELTEIAKARTAALKLRGKAELKRVEKQVKAKPAQSIAIAFAGGILASMLLRGRR